MALSYLRISDEQNEILFRCFILFVCVTSTFGYHQTFRAATSGNSNSVVPSASTTQENQDQIRYSNVVEETSSSNAGRDAKLKCLTSSQRRRTLVKTSLTEEERLLKIQRIKRSTTDRRQSGNLTPGDGSHIANVAYFDLDSDFLYYSHLHDTGEDVYFPAEKFSVEMWVKPEGGQATGAVIAELSDKCKPSGNWGWSIGINSLDTDETPDNRFFFRVMTDRSVEPTIIRAHQTYKHDHWTHIVVTYDGSYQLIYIDGALVGKGRGQIGPIFSPVTFICKQLTIGGSGVKGTQFRGMVDILTISPFVFSHEEVARYSQNRESIERHNYTLREEFGNLDNWESFDHVYPRLMTSSMPPSIKLELKVPPCGFTVCDNVDLMGRYINEPNLRNMKVLKYRYITVSNDDGTDPVVTTGEIDWQHRLVQDAYRPHNLVWDLEIHFARNSTLKLKTVMLSCTEEQIGDGHCDSECDYELTGYDGGDCFTSVASQHINCTSDMLGDGICHGSCNIGRFYYDNGDCCDRQRTDTLYCRDPNHLERTFISLNRYKKAIGLESTTHLNLYLVPIMETGVMGLAAYPWHSEALTMYGGSVISIDALRYNSTVVIHELGHNLGLLHTHHGISEVSCSHSCRETHPSLSLGDLVQDTNPTPLNFECHDPFGLREYRVCDFDKPPFRNTPYKNFMGFGDDNCVNHFTPQQAARMHCYVDLSYGSWRSSESRTVKPILPYSPTIVRTGVRPHLGERTVTLAWMPALGSETNPGESCADCNDDGALRVYASSVFYCSDSTRLHGMALYATGPPDSERCRKDSRLWYPPYPREFNCDQSDCYLEMEFDYPIVAKKISIWVTYSPKGTTMDLDLVMTDGDVVSLGMIHVSCDVPYTRTLDTHRTVDKVRLHLWHPTSYVDSILLESAPDHILCENCSPIYALSRNPSFRDGMIMALSETQFTDRDIEEDIVYSYSLMAVSSGGASGHFPTPTHYYVGKAFCGDGIINVEEKCDDGNVFSGDGCNLHCDVEDYFLCEGQPSLCRYYRGDGECEVHELSTDSWEDCGFIAPGGFQDQWASKAEITQENDTRCDPLKLIGPAPMSKTCRIFDDEDVFEDELSRSLHDAWSPCVVDDLFYEVEVSFGKPVIATSVILHLAGVVDFSSDMPVRVTVFLKSPQGHIHTVAADRIFLGCEDSPYHIRINQNLANPFHYTKYVRLRFNNLFRYIAVYGIRLRNSLTLNPLAIGSCDAGNLYNPSTQSCGDYGRFLPTCRDVTNEIRNANTTCSGNQEGDFCQVQCNMGYRPSKVIDLLCTNGIWQNLDSAICKPVVCAMPSIINGATSCPSGMAFRKRCTFKCTPPAKLKGGEDSNEIFCQEDGLFSLPGAFCQLLCDAPAIPTNSHLLTKHCIRGGQVVGTKCKFRCATGFESNYSSDVGHHIGSERVSRVFYHRCSQLLSWVGPSCQRVTCPPIPQEFNGKFDCTDGLYYDSRCIMTCPASGMEPQVITCSKYGAWIGQFRICEDIPV